MQLKGAGIEATRQFRFDCSRRWRADFWVGPALIVEVEGGVWSNGRHVRGSGFEADARKYNAAAIIGYRVLRFSTGMVKSGEALRTIEKALGRA